MKSIVIGIDGAEPKLIEKWIDDLPNIQKFYGCFGKLESTLPPSSAPAWTSIVTGVNPEKHGIFDFFYFDRETMSIKTISSRFRKVPAIWNLLSRIGRNSIVVNVPVTYPPERINGVIVSGLLTPPNENFVEPKEAKQLLKGYKMEHLIIDDLPIRISARYNPEKVMNILREWIEWRRKAFIMLLKNYSWDFGMVVFRASDLVQHFLWDSDYVFQIYKKIDEEIGKIMELYKANYFIVSDHGFYGIKKNIFLNNLLYEKKYLEAIGRIRTIDIGKRFAKLLYYLPKKFIRLFRKHLFSIASKENVIDFKKSKAFCLSSSSRAIVAKKEVKNEIIELINNFEDNNIKPMKATETNDYIVIDLMEGYAIVDVLNFRKIIDKPGEFHFKGEHSKYGIFMAYGKNIKEWNGEIKVVDVLPTVFHSMNLPIPLHVDGKVAEIFKKLNVKKVDWNKYGISEKELKIIKSIVKLSQ